MIYRGKKAVSLILPYAVWMLLMLLLPSTPECYAARALTVFLLLIPCLLYLARHRALVHSGNVLKNELGWGVLVGLLVWAIWVYPESFAWYRRWFIFGEGGTAAIDESDAVFKLVRFLGSAFVISVAEELFFRKWLLKFAGFWWTVALFAVEHDRWLVGAIAGILYGVLAIRKGLTAAIVAHCVTNLTLGLYVLQTGHWEFW